MGPRNPIARTEGVVARELGTGLVVLSAGHVVHRLDVVTAWIWRHADGSRDIDALLAGLRAEANGEADRELVYEALDRLADASLLQERLGPPSGLSRRIALRRLAGAGAIAALTAVLGVPRSALGKEAICEDEQAILEAIVWLEAEEAAVAEILDEWVDDVISGDELDEAYLAELKLREQSWKKRADARESQREDAELDLSACALDAKKGPQLAAREKDRKKSFQHRAERLAARSKFAQERHRKRSQQHELQEQDQKTALQNKEKDHKGLPGKGVGLTAEEATQKQALSAARLKQRQKAEESRIKMRSTHLEQESKALELKRESAMKKLDQQLVQGEEKVKATTDAYSSKLQEAAAKSQGVQDRALEIAQEEALKASKAAEETVKVSAKEQNQKLAAAEEKQKLTEAAAEEKAKLQAKATEEKQKLDTLAQEKAAKAL